MRISYVGEDRSPRIRSPHWCGIVWVDIRHSDLIRNAVATTNPRFGPTSLSYITRTVHRDPLTENIDLVNLLPSPFDLRSAPYHRLTELLPLHSWGCTAVALDQGWKNLGFLEIIFRFFYGIFSFLRF